MTKRRVHFGMMWLLLSLSMAAPAVASVPAPDALREEAIRLESRGIGLRDFREAHKLFCLAALEGDSRAAYHLGSLYLNGSGPSGDHARAAGWLVQASNLGDPDAEALLKTRLTSVSPVADPDCPLVNARPKRKEISTWVHLLAPYYELSPGLVLSIIKVESNFNARARSPKDAFGLMQLIQPTADRFNVEDVWNPWQNIKGGMAYLAWLREHFQEATGRKLGRVKLMLAAYNAGEAAVARYDGIPPYDETRKYVKRVVRIYTNYVRARKASRRSPAGSASRKQARAATTTAKSTQGSALHASVLSRVD